ncbi:MAG: hypothetical protein JSW66_05095 [Phycisphaerales bacterium]|nr:MAG: hypothetical protein JSW66_05095 [Phycisphaerales bacterium]
MSRYEEGRAVVIRVTAVALIFGLGGCIGSRQALLTTQKLQLTSEQASNVVSQAKANEGMTVEAHREIRKAYRQLSEKTWQSLLEVQQRTLEAAYRNSIAALEAERARLLVEREQERMNLQEAIDNKLNEALTEADRNEATAEAASLEARKQYVNAPGDLTLLQKSLEADVAYFALAARLRDIELRARDRIQSEIDNADKRFNERLEIATKKHREELLALYTDAKDKLAGAEMPTIDLGPEPEVNHVFYDSLIQYLAGVQQSAAALVDYLESNGIGENNLLMEYLRAAGGGLVSGVFRPAASLKNAYSTLRESAKGLGRDYLSEIKTAGTEAKTALSREARDIAGRLTEELLNRVSAVAVEAIGGTE